MGKFMKPGRVCIVLTGRQAGKKAIIVHSNDKGTNNRKFPHALVAGVERAPLKVTKKMGKKRLAKRSRVKPFSKFINFNHLLPTRYTVPDFDLSAVNSTALAEPETKKEAKKALKEEFESRYVKGSDKENAACLLYTSPSPRDKRQSRMPSSA